MKHHHSFENKKQNTLLGGSDYADSKKLTTVQPTAPGPSSLIVWVLGPKLKNSFPNKQSTRPDLFFCSINNNPQSTEAEYLVSVIYAGSPGEASIAVVLIFGEKVVKLCLV